MFNFMYGSFVKPVAYWSGTVEYAARTNTSGPQRITLDES